VLGAAVIVVFAGMPLPTITCPTVGAVEKETLETVVDPDVVVAPKLVSVTMSPAFVDVTAAEIVRDVGGLPLVPVT
jgi:hypothetical protein